MDNYRDMYPPDIFITYANTPLKSNPMGLYKTLEEMVKLRYWKNWEPVFTIGIKKIVGFIPGSPKTRFTISELIRSLPDNFYKTCPKELLRQYRDYFLKLRNDIIGCAEREIYVPYDEKYGKEMVDGEVYERDWDYTGPSLASIELAPDQLAAGGEIIGEKCAWADIRREIFDTKDLPCYECHHQHFLYMMTEVTKGNKFFNIKGLETLIENLSQAQKDILFNEKLIGRPSRKKIKEDILFRVELPGAFPAVFSEAVMCSFLIFLKSNGPRELKRCPVCEEFFIASDIRREVCYPPKECERVRKNKYMVNYMQRKRDKNGPDFDERYI